MTQKISNPFSYRVLLIDDKQVVVQERIEELRKHGVEVEFVPNIDAALKTAFGIEDILSVNLEGNESQFRHRFDLVLIDYELVDADDDKQYRGGHNLYQLFVNTFDPSEKGECAVAVYSSKFEDKHPKLFHLFALAEKTRLLRVAPEYALIGNYFLQGSASDFNLQPLIKFRATTILQNASTNALKELSDAFAGERATTWEDILDKRLDELSDYLGRDTTLKKLRPDFLCSSFAFVPPGDSKGEKDALRSLEFWIRDLCSSKNLLASTRNCYKSNKTPAYINNWAHKSALEFDADLAEYIDDGNRIHEYEISPELAKELASESKNKSGVERCSFAHFAFRLDLGDHSQDSLAYVKGYRLEDLNPVVGEETIELVSSITLQEGISRKKYLYIHRAALEMLLSRLADETNSREVQVSRVVSKQGKAFAVFSFVQSDTVTEKNVFEINHRRFGPKPESDSWCDLMVCTYNRKLFVYAYRFPYYANSRFESRDFLPNSFSLCFPLQD